MANNSVRLSAIQLLPRADWRDSLLAAEKKIEQAAALGAQLVLLPELFLIPYELERVSECAQRADGEVFSHLSSCAKKHRIWLFAGSVPLREEAGLFNACPVFNPTGALVGVYCKVHLFDVGLDAVSVQESKVFAPGGEIFLADTPWGKIGAAICYDLRFPRSFIQMAQSGARLILVPAAFNTTTGPKHFHLLGQARALDSQSFVALCSPARGKEARYTVYGHSAVISPMGEVLGELGEDEGILTVDLDLAQAETLRASLPILRAQRPGVDF